MISTQQLLEMIKEMSAIIQQNKDFLTELDMPIGDSDHGINLARGFQAVEAKIPTMEGKDAVVTPIGKKATEFFKNKKMPLFLDSEMEAEDLSPSHCFSLAKQICKAFLSGEYSEVFIGYTNFVSVLTQSPASLPLLPLSIVKSGAPQSGHKQETLARLSSGNHLIKGKHDVSAIQGRNRKYVEYRQHHRQECCNVPKTMPVPR